MKATYRSFFGLQKEPFGSDLPTYTAEPAIRRRQHSGSASQTSRSKMRQGTPQLRSDAIFKGNRRGL